jgi:hypothetical protein
MKRFLTGYTAKLAIEYQEARAATLISYWGPLVSPKTGVESPMLTRFIISIYNCCVSLSEPPVLPSTSKNHAKGCLMPEIVSSILSEFGFANPTFDLEVLETCGVATVDAEFSAFYLSFGIHFTKNEEAIVSPFGGQVRRKGVCPLLSCDGLLGFIPFLIRHDPDSMQKAFNKVLGEDPLLDPETGKPFLYKEIPRACFPAVPDPVAGAKYRAAMAKYDRMDQVIAEAAMKTLKTKEAAEIEECMTGMQSSSAASSSRCSDTGNASLATSQKEAAINAAYARVQAAEAEYKATRDAARGAEITASCDGIAVAALPGPSYAYSRPGYEYIPWVVQNARNIEEKALRRLKEEEKRFREISDGV